MGKRIDLTGQDFGRLRVVKHAGTTADGHALWLCQCTCGKEVFVSGNALRRGNTKSCGCYNRDVSTARIVAKNTTHGGTGTRLFRIWSNMKTRCYNPNAINYDNYGGRGITVCDEWRDDFTTFREWALANGYTNSLTLDRIDNDRGYSPDNCRWATIKEQMNNRRSNTVVSYGGEAHTVTEWAAIIGIAPDALLYRINCGRYTVEQALTLPKMRKREPARRRMGGANA